MKCQRNASPYSACFASRSCARFSPTTVDAGLDEHRHVGDARRTSSPRRSSPPARPLPGPARSARGSAQATAPITPCTPRAQAVAAVREEELRMVARAEVDALDARRRPRGASARSAAVQRSSLPSRVRSASKRSDDLRPDLVAARPDRRPDHGRLRARRRAPRRRPATTPSASPRQPACRTASARPPLGRARRRSAGSRRTSRASARPRSSVQSPSPGAPRAPGVARGARSASAPAG